VNEFQERIGVGKPSYMVLRKRGTSRTTPVIREEGRTRGQVGGAQTEHWDGRVDAVATPESVEVTMSRRDGTIKDVSV